MTDDIPKAIATLKAAGYVMIEPDKYSKLAQVLCDEIGWMYNEEVANILRRAISAPASIDLREFAK
jgi:hypothetical protein